jgi:glycosyltransferase involved in cell wall biosynthesis
MPSSYAVVAGDFVQTGGMDRANYALASYLARSDRTVHVIACRVADDLAAMRNVVVHRIPRPFGAHALGGALLGSLGLGKVALLASRGSTVLVNGGNCLFPAANWVHYVHAAYGPVVATGGLRATTAFAAHAGNRVCERAALRAARIVIANSERTRRDVIERVGVRADLVTTVYLATDGSRFHPVTVAERSVARRLLGCEGGRPRIAFVGALGDRRKGFDIVYDAWRTLCRTESWDAELVVVGSGAELPSWKVRAERDRIAGRITFLGFRSDVAWVLATCDALVAPSRYEPYGLAAHEALCRGLPAFVPDTAGIAERYPKSLNQLLLGDAASADALATALIHWRHHTSEVGAEVLAFSASLRARSWDDMAREIVALCDDRA